MQCPAWDSRLHAEALTPCPCWHALPSMRLCQQGQGGSAFDRREVVSPWQADTGQDSAGACRVIQTRLYRASLHWMGNMELGK